MVPPVTTLTRQFRDSDTFQSVILPSLVDLESSARFSNFYPANKREHRVGSLYGLDLKAAFITPAVS